METVRTVPRPEATPDLSFSFSPTVGPFAYAVGATVYTPSNAFRVNTATAITFTATVKMPQGKWVTSYEWDFGDGTRGYGNPAVHTYTAASHAQAVLTVVDNEGNRWRARRQLYLREASVTLGVALETDSARPLTIS